LDTGASDVSLPADVFHTLARTKTLGESDYIGPGKYGIADGSVSERPRYLLHELKVGNRTLTNVDAHVQNEEGPPLLGQSFLSKIGAWSINNERHVLFLGSPTLTAGPNPSGAPPISPVLPATRQVAAFEDGLRDRASWEQWFSGTAGSFKDGVEYWSGQRSLPHPGSCYGLVSEHLGDWTAGCLAAKRFLDPTDIRRKAEPEYRAGWNSYRG